MCGRSLSLPLRNTQFLQAYGGWQEQGFSNLHIQISKALQLKTVFPVKTQVRTQPGSLKPHGISFLHSSPEPRVTSSPIRSLLCKRRKRSSFESWGVTLTGSLGTQYQWRSLFPLPWMQQYIKREKKGGWLFSWFSFLIFVENGTVFSWSFKQMEGKWKPKSFS